MLASASHDHIFLSPEFALDSFHFSMSMLLAWLVQHPKVTCGQNCCPPTPPPSGRRVERTSSGLLIDYELHDDI
jgi:hypothetical protein